MFGSAVEKGGGGGGGEIGIFVHSAWCHVLYLFAMIVFLFVFNHFFFLDGVGAGREQGWVDW